MPRMPIDVSIQVRVRLVVQVLVLFSVGHALVAIPERQVVKTLVISSSKEENQQLYLETFPLIGGPSWLPLHVKVVLQSDTEQHLWDLIPLQPTDPNTLRSLLSLQAVPGRVRYQHKTVSLTRPPPPVSMLPHCGIVLENDPETTTEREPPRLLQVAEMFCATFPAEIHLVRNNCWSFAWKLYDALLEEQSRQQDSL